MKARKFLKRGLALALSLALLITLVPVAYAEDGAQTEGFYHVSGTQILDGNNREVLLKGMSFGNMNYGNPSSVELENGNGVRNDHDADSYKELAAMGLDHVRFEFNYGLFEDDSNPGVYKEEGFAWLDENIAWAKAAGVKLILQMKSPQGGYQNATGTMYGENSGGKALWIDIDENGVHSTENYKQNQERLVNLWGAIAEHYKDEPTIIGYGLLNEPAVPQKDTAQETTAQWQDLAQRIADAIRRTDTNHMLFVECVCSWFKPGDYNGTNWNLLSISDQQFTINDANTVYEFHFYEPLDYTHQGASWVDTGAGDKYYDGVSFAELEISDWNSRGNSTNATTSTDGEWAYFESAAFQKADNYNIAQPRVNMSSIAANSSIWVDDLTITRIDGQGKETVVLRYDFTDTVGGFFKVWNGSDDYNAITLDNSVGHNAAGSMKLTNNLSGAANQWANAQSSDSIMLEEGCSYKISGYVKGGTASHCPSAQFLYASNAWLMNKDYLEHKLDEYLAFGTTNQIPQHVGEWGFHYNCYDKGADQYTQDLIELFAEKNLSSNYHSYHDSTFGLYLSEEYQARPERNETLYTILTSHYCTPVETALTSVTLSESTVTVQGGDAADIAVTAAAKDQAGGTFADVTWSISGGDAANVTIDPASGVITVKAKAKAGNYTVTATDSNSKTATATLTVERAASRAITVTMGGGQNEILVPANDAADNVSAAFTASVTDQFDDVFSGNVAWSIAPAIEGVSIGTDGVVTVTNAAKAAVTDTVEKQLTVTAACSGISGTAAIQVKRAASQVTTVSLTRGGVAVGGTDTLVIPAAGTAEYTYAVKVLDQYGAEMDGQAVAWTFTPAAADANVTFDNAGKVTVAAGAKADGTFTLKAETGGQSAQTVITVKDISIDWPRVTVAENPTYGQKWSEIITLSGGSAALNDQTVAGSFTVKEAGDYPAAGSQSYTVNFTSSDGAYHIDKAGEAVAIAQKPVTVKAVDLTRVYGEDTPVATYTVPDGALVGNDTEEDLGIVELTTKSSSADVGAYPITGACSNEGNYVVTVTPGTLTIVPADIGKAVITAIAPVTYHGAPQTPQPIVTYSGTTLTKDTDYTVTYADHTNAGTATVTVAGKGNYTGTLSKSFTIRPKALDDSMISWDSADPVIYDKTAKTPAYTVTDGSRTLVKGKDYSEEFTNNVNAGSGAALTITGAGNYTSTAAKTFVIQKASLTDKKPAITGTAAAGNVLTARLDGVAAEEITWAWTVGSNPSAGTGAAYTVQPTDSNQVITVKATASGTNYQDSTQPSDGVQVAKTTVTGTVTIALSTDADGNGAIDAGDTLTASVSVTPAVAVTYQWYNNGTAIDGAESQTYTVAECMTGTITVTVTPGEDYEGSVTSAAMEIGKSTLAGTVTISGSTAVGSVLTAAISVSPATENDYDITWLRDGTAIDGAAETVYTVTADDLGKTISVKVTAKAESAYTGELVSAGMFIPAAVPDAPVLTLTPSNGSIIARWTAPADNGAAITGYILTITDGGQYSDTVSVDSSTTSYTFSGLTNGTAYTVTITAANSAGTGAAAEQTASPRASGGSGGNTPIGPSDPEPTVEIVTTESGNTATITTQPDGGREIEVKTASGETVAKIDLPADPGEGKKFTDVKGWYEGAVDKATAYGLFNGTSETTFSPGRPMTRGMLATVLYNLSGKSQYGVGEGAFGDVSENVWYENAVDWAAKTGVTSGTSKTEFSPNRSITREQLVTMLYRYAKLIGADTKKTAGLEKFPDAGNVSGYAKESMQWAVAEGFISGRASGGKDYIAPQGTATRAEVAAVLTRFVEYLKK